MSNIFIGNAGGQSEIELIVESPKLYSRETGPNRRATIPLGQPEGTENVVGAVRQQTYPQQNITGTASSLMSSNDTKIV